MSLSKYSYFLTSISSLICRDCHRFHKWSISQRCLKKVFFTCNVLLFWFIAFGDPGLHEANICIVFLNSFDFNKPIILLLASYRAYHVRWCVRSAFLFMFTLFARNSAKTICVTMKPPRSMFSLHVICCKYFNLPGNFALRIFKICEPSQ